MREPKVQSRGERNSINLDGGDVWELRYRGPKDCVRLFISRLDATDLNGSHSFMILQSMYPTSQGHGVDVELVGLSFDNRHDVLDTSGFSAGMER